MDDYETDIQSFKSSRFVMKLLVLLAVVAFVWFFRPWFHWLLYSVFYSPFGAIALGGGFIVATLIYLAPPFSSRSSDSVMMKGIMFGAIFAFLLVVGVLVGGIGGVFEEMDKADTAMENVEIVDEPPEMNEENPRVTPRAVSDTQTDGTFSYPQHTLGESDIARTEDGNLAWSYPIVPDQTRNQFSDNQRGLVHADMTAMESRSVDTYDEHEYTYGQNMRLWDNVEWQMKKADDGFFSQYNDDPYEVYHDGEAYMVYPKTGHEWNRAYGVIPYTKPVWDGVALVHQDGTIEHLDAEEAQERPELDGQRLYPLDVSEEYSEALQYREGFWNQFWLGEYDNVVVPSDVPSDTGNDQPFVVDMEDETMGYVYAMQPPGGGTGLSELWYFNAETGDMEVYETGSDNVFGPDRAVGIAQGTDTRTEWGPDGDAMAVEPIPMTVDGTLYWHIKVVTADQTDVVRNIFVNAESGSSTDDTEEAADDAVVMESTTEVEEFIAGDIDEDDVDSANESASIEEPDEESDDNVEYYIVIEDDMGQEVDRIPVEEGQETTIETEAEAEENEDE